MLEIGFVTGSYLTDTLTCFRCDTNNNWIYIKKKLSAHGIQRTSNRTDSKRTTGNHAKKCWNFLISKKYLYTREKKRVRKRKYLRLALVLGSIFGLSLVFIICISNPAASTLATRTNLILVFLLCCLLSLLRFTIVIYGFRSLWSENCNKKHLWSCTGWCDVWCE